jgi:hypothetical protein
MSVRKQKADSVLKTGSAYAVKKVGNKRLEQTGKPIL